MNTQPTTAARLFAATAAFAVTMTLLQSVASLADTDRALLVQRAHAPQQLALGHAASLPGAVARAHN